jgi:hypothetical protein
MEILSDGFKYVLELHAFLPAPDVQFEPFVNLGFSALDKSKSTAVLFRNDGNVDGHVELRYDQTLSPEIVIEPTVFKINAMEES